MKVRINTSQREFRISNIGSADHYPNPLMKLKRIPGAIIRTQNIEGSFANETNATLLFVALEELHNANSRIPGLKEALEQLRPLVPPVTSTRQAYQQAVLPVTGSSNGSPVNTTQNVSMGLN